MAFSLRPIETVLSLLSPGNTQGNFNVSTTSSNNRVKVDYDTSPVDSTLTHTLHTSNGPATVNLHRAYEGAFSVESSMVGPAIVDEDHAEDPSGRHRRRWIEIFEVTKTKITGGMYWGEKTPDAKGRVDMMTSNAPAKLRFL